MNKKLLGLIPLVLMLGAILPAFAYIPPPPPPPPTPEFAIKINDTWTWDENRGWYNFTGINYCTTFSVDVWVLDVTDLFAYEFKLSWDETYFSLVSYEVLKIHANHYVIKPDALYDKSSPYVQVVTAYDSPGFNGSAKVAHLVFHIDNDAKWYFDGILVKTFHLYDTNMSNSCSAVIQHGTEDGYVALVPKKPKICFDKAKVTSTKVGDKFTLTVVVTDIVRMKSIDFYVMFDTDCLTTSLQDIVIHEDLLPRPWEEFALDVDLVLGGVYLKIQRPCVKDAMNGTGNIMSITFTTLDCWDFPDDFPEYTLNQTTHIWTSENCTSYITKAGLIDVIQPDGTVDYYELDEPLMITNTPTEFKFTPIPGDLDFSGHVDLVDIKAIAAKYGTNFPLWDFVPSAGFIDIFDIVVVAKYYCKTTP